MLTSHEELNITSCVFYVSVEHPFWGASSDALIECKCCGLGVVEIYVHRVLSKALLQKQLMERGISALKNVMMASINSNDTINTIYYQCQLQMFVTGSI